MIDTPLFPDMPEVLSPRLAFLRKHDLKTWHTDHMEPGELPWACCKRVDAESGDIGPENCGIGRTEDEAIMDLCLILGIPHWTLQ